MYQQAKQIPQFAGASLSLARLLNDLGLAQEASPVLSIVEPMITTGGTPATLIVFKLELGRAKSLKDDKGQCNIPHPKSQDEDFRVIDAPIPEGNN